MSGNRESWLVQLRAVAKIEDPINRSLSILSILTEAMESVGVRPILVGGKAVEFYTHGSYFTYDTDLVLNGRELVVDILNDLGFQKRSGERHWYNTELDFALEIPDSSLAGSMEKVNVTEVNGKKIYVIGYEDLIADRLRACYFWKSSRDCEQAENLLTVHFKEIDLDYLREQLKNDKLDHTLDELIQKGKSNRHKLGLD